MNQRLFAFWKYDLFPYFVGSEIDRINPDGTVHSITFCGSCKPVIILPIEQGEKLKEQLEVLKGEFRSDEQELKIKYKQKLKDIASFYQG